MMLYTRSTFEKCGVEVAYHAILVGRRIAFSIIFVNKLNFNLDTLYNNAIAQ
jgi:hypothetical protein